MIDEASRLTSQTFFSVTMRALGQLQALTISVDASRHLPFNDSEFKWPILRKALALLDEVPALGAVLDLDKQLTDKWLAFSQSSGTTSFTARETKRLCWQPTIVVQKGFQQLASKQKGRFSAGCIKGLLYSYHSQYEKLSNNTSIEGVLNDGILSLGKSDPLIRKWASNITSIVGQQASTRLARDILDEEIKLEDAFDAYGIYPSTAFATDSANVCVLLYADRLNKLSDKQIDLFYQSLITSPLIDKETFKEVVSSLISSPIHDNDGAQQQRLLDFLLTRSELKDPRMFPEKWVGIDSVAKQRVIQWLSREDINFFFELLISDRADRQSRKSFWIDYVPHVSRSRALLFPADRRKHSIKLQQLEKRGRTHGELTGAQSSAFILDFGRIVVVEFSEVGSVYVYDQADFMKLLKDFWASKLSVEALRNKKRAIEVIRHDKNWQPAIRTCLVHHGVRR